MSRPLAVFDASWVMHRARHAMPNLSFEDMPTGIIFGMFETILSTCTDTRVGTHQVAICFDSRQSYRKDLFPAYKAKRHTQKRTDLEIAELALMAKQAEFLRIEILPEIGFPVFRQCGCESDDLMAQIALQRGDVGGVDTQVVLITSDTDLYQCITQNTVHWFNSKEYLNHMGLWAKKGVEPDDWAMVKAIGGCGTDEVPGVENVAEKTAIQYLTKTLKPSSKRFLAIVSDQGQRIIKRNLPLVTLPFPKTKPVILTEPKYDAKAFFKWSKKLGMDSYLQGGRERAWNRFFDGEIGGFHQVPREPGRSRT